MYEAQSNALNIFDSIIKPENINGSATNAINNCIAKRVPLECEFLESSSAFNTFCEKFKDLFKSNDVKKDLIFSTNESIESPYNHISIEIGIPYTEKSFLIHIFEKVILVYFLPQSGCKNFLAALNTSTLKISSRKTSYRESVIVWEKTRLPIREYDSYSPVKDAKIISSQWTKTNIDGQRSFAGGLKPENNPLIFTLQYGILSLCFNNTTYNIEFSRSEETFEAVSAFNSLTLTEFSDSNSNEKNTIYNSALNTVKASFEKFTNNKFRSNKQFVKPLVILAIILLGIPVLAFLLTAIEWLIFFFVLSQ